MNRDKIIQLAVSIIMIAAMLFGRPVSFPDNVHTQHGLPLVWGTHQLVTIAGPVDYWYVNMVNLGIDLAFWISLVLVAPYASALFQGNYSKESVQEYDEKGI